MTLPNLFYRRVERLDELSSSRDPYDALEMATIIRSLLISDHNGLTAQLLREHPELKPIRKKSKITFVINEITPFGDYGWVMEGIDPEIHPSHAKPKRCTRDSFLATPIVKIEDRYITVYQIVNFLANKDGGVHRDRKSADKSLIELQDEFHLAGSEGVSATMMGVSRVVVRGLYPIMKSIEENKTNV